MALKLTVDSVEGMDDALKALYVADGDKFKLDVDGIEDTSGLKTALQKERRAASELEKKTKAWERLGKTPDEIQELLEAQEKTARTEQEKRGEFDKILAQVNEKNAQALKAKDDAISEMRKIVETEKIDKAAIAAIAAAKGKPKLLLPHVQKHVRVDEKFNVIVVDDKGDPRVNGKGEPLGISDFIEEMRQSDDFGAAFEGSGQSGSGTPPTNGTGGPKGRITKADLTDRKTRTAFVAQFGVKAYESLPAK